MEATQIADNNPATDIVPQYSWPELTGEELPEETSILPASQLQGLAETFAPFMEQIMQKGMLVHDIEVTDENDKAGMAEAKRLRIAIKNVRVEAQKVHKREKEYPKIAGRTVDYFWRMIRERAELWESQLKEHEEFAARIEAERKRKLAEERQELLAPYVESAEHYDLENMEVEAFSELLDNCKFAHEARVEKERQEAEAKRQREEEARKEMEKLREETKRLKMENEAAHAELKAKQEAEAAKQREEERARIKEAAASDKDKLRGLYRAIQAIEIPQMQDAYYVTIGEQTKLRLQEILAYIEYEAKQAA